MSSPAHTDDDSRIDAEVRQFAHLGNGDIGSAPEPKTPIIFWLIGLLLFIGGTSLFGYALVKGQFISLTSSEVIEKTSVSVVSQAAKPSFTPAPAQKSALKIRILNGSGTPGTAITAKTYLESLGYSGLETGNAGTYDYQDTTIYSKPGNESAAETLKTELSQKYKISTDIKPLATSSEFDLEIIIGK